MPRPARIPLLAMLVAIPVLPRPLGAQTAPEMLPEIYDGADTPTAFLGVTVIPMDEERLLPDLTVVVRDGYIVAMGPAAEVEVPRDARRIDGQGLYLMPGLADMHVRLENPNELLLYIANGVTTVRNFGSPAMALALRARVDAGELPGPRIYSGGPTIDRHPVSASDHVPVVNVEEARRVVREQAAMGVDFIEVTTLLPPELYAAVAREAAEVGLPLAGEAPLLGGIAAALATGQASIDRLSSLVLTYFGDRLDAAGISRLATALRAEDLSVTTAVSAFDKVVAQLGDPVEMRRLMARPELRYVSPETRRAWGPGNFFVSIAPSPFLREVRAFTNDVVRGLHEGGVRLVLGTEATVAGNVPGFSIHDELRLLVEAGLSPYVALRAGTVSAAELAGAVGEFGVVAPGNRADLLLLDENPLDDIGHVAHRVGVMVAGRWLSEDTLASGLERLAAGYPELPWAHAYPFRVERPEPMTARRDAAGAGSR